jgi:tripartite ATP-independent transporter DctM subunit
MSGTNVAATVTAATIAMPSMLKRNYDKLMITGIVQAGGALGFLIPPSIVFILYGVIAKVSIGHLWVAGILPGILLAVMYIIYIGIRCKIQAHLGPPIPVEERATLNEKFRALGAGIAPVILIFIVLGLLFMGVTTLIECAAIGAVGALAAAAINRRLSFQIIKETVEECLAVTCMVLWIFAAALTFGAVFDGLGAVHAMANLLEMFSGGSPLGTIIVMQLSFILMGMVLDDTAMLLIVAPLYIPLVADLGYSLVWFGVLYVVNCQMAFLTPPFGYNLFLIKGLIPTVAPKSGIGMGDIYRSVIPFVVIQAICLLIIVFVPQIALFLPSIVFGG